MHIVEHLSAEDFGSRFTDKLKQWFCGDSQTETSDTGDLFAVRKAPEGGHELRLLLDQKEAVRIAKEKTTAVVCISSQTNSLDIKIDDLKTKEDWSCNLALSGHWSVRNPRKFLNYLGLDRVANGPLSAGDVAQEIAVRLRTRLSSETSDLHFEELKEVDVLPPQWFDKQFDGALVDLGLSVHAIQVQWNCPDAEANEAFRRESEKKKKERDKELAEVKHVAGVSAIQAESEAENAKKRLEVERWQTLVDQDRAKVRREEAEAERIRVLGEAEKAREEAASAKNEAERNYWTEKANELSSEQQKLDKIITQIDSRDQRMEQIMEQVKEQWSMNMEFLQSIRTEREDLVNILHNTMEQSAKQPLQVDVRWRALEAPKQGQGSIFASVKKDPLDRWDFLRSGDSLQVRATPNQDVYLYIFAVGPYPDKQGKIGYEWRTLFSNDCKNDLYYPLQREQGNLAVANREICLPADGAEEADFKAHAWALDWDSGGMEQVFLLASQRMLVEDEIEHLLPTIPERPVVSTRGFANYANKDNDLSHPPPPRIAAAFHSAAQQKLGDAGTVHGLAIVHL